MRMLILMLLLLTGAGSATAAPFSHAPAGMQVAARDYMRPQPQGMLPNNRSPKVGSQQAAASVRQAYANNKILSVQLIASPKGPPVYRVKTLSPDGVVKYVFVDGTSGDIFE